MASAVGFQLIFGFFFMIAGLFILFKEFWGGLCEILFYSFMFCLFFLPAFISPIVGFVSLYYDVQLFDDAVLSFKIYQAFAILTTINISTVSHDNQYGHNITIYLIINVILLT